jgi:hypothetical protein
MKQKLSYNFPILISTFIRFETLTILLNQLVDVKFLEVVFVKDGPRNTEIDKLKSNHVTKVIKEFNGINPSDNFKIINSSTNIGPFENIRRGLEYVFSKYDFVLYLEDDVVISKQLLEFVRIVIDERENFDQPRIINGFLPFRNNRTNNYFLSKEFTTFSHVIFSDAYIESLAIQEILKKATLESCRNELLRHGYNLIKYDKYYFQRELKKYFLNKKFNYELFVKVMLCKDKNYSVFAPVNLTKINIEYSQDDSENYNFPGKLNLLPTKVRNIYKQELETLKPTEYNLAHIEYYSEYDLQYKKSRGDLNMLNRFFFRIEQIYLLIINVDFRLIYKKILRGIVQNDI